MTPMQQMFLGLGAASKTYLDNVFSTYLYEGNDSTQTITNGLDMASDGGMIWVKNRDTARDNSIIDTARGIGKRIETNKADAEDSYVTSKNISSFTSTGFTLGVDEGHGEFNANGNDYCSWNFKKQKGFFTMVQWTGNGADDRAISHDLGCIPGMIIVKALNDSSPWTVYHRGIGATKYLYLNDSQGEATDEWWADTTPTASNFYVQSTRTNANNTTFIAYLFAGGASTAATAKSVDFDGSNDYLSIPDSADFNLGTNSFTIEGWVYPDAGSMTSGYYGMICGQTSANWYVTIRGGSGLNSMQYYDGVSAHNSAANSILAGQWTHIAFVNNGGTGTWYINGIASTSGDSVSAPNIPNSSGAFEIGRNNSASYFNGKISNLRVVKGTAVYTSSFKPPTEPLGNITNTKLLCCNDSSQTGSTVTPGTITNNGSTASTDSPFDDPSAFLFGEEGDQNIIKQGSYTKTDTGSSNTLQIELGWEPQVIIQKRTDGSGDWYVMDVMRDMSTQLTQILRPNLDNAEVSYGDTIVVPNSTGFTVKDNNSDSYVYTAIRRPDGYVSEPIEVGTNVFAMDMGVGSTSDPAFLSGFPVDFTIYTEPAGGSAKSVGTRLLGSKKMASSATDAQSDDTKAMWDSNGGYGINRNSDFIAWMWRRCEGMDLVDYEGDGVNGRSIAHSMNSVPQMMIAKRRSSTEDWSVYHIGLNGGTNPYTKVMTLNSTATEVDMTGTPEKVFKSTPTSTHFEIGSHDRVNTDGQDYHVLLFSSISGVSKVGYYTGNGSSGLSVTVGFQPRFILFRGTNMGGPWRVLDSLRGMSSGNDKSLSLNSTGAEVTNFDWLDVTSTGWTINTTDGEANASGKNYIYYAHA